MIRWRASTQLTYSGEQFADIFRATAQWSQRSHIPVDVVSAQEAVDQTTGRLHYDLDVHSGFENIPDIFNCLFTGAHTGRLVVQID